jgi:hypothetical protein
MYIFTVSDMYVFTVIDIYIFTVSDMYVCTVYGYKGKDFSNKKSLQAHPWGARHSASCRVTLFIGEVLSFVSCIVCAFKVLFTHKLRGMVHRGSLSSAFALYYIFKSLSIPSSYRLNYGHFCISNNFFGLLVVC